MLQKSFISSKFLAIVESFEQFEGEKDADRVKAENKSIDIEGLSDPSEELFKKTHLFT